MCALCVLMMENCHSNYDQGIVVQKAGGSYSQRNTNTAAAEFGSSFVVDPLKSQKDRELNLNSSAPTALPSTFSAGLGNWTFG